MLLMYRLNLVPYKLLLMKWKKGIGVRIRRSGGIGSDYNLTLMVWVVILSASLCRWHSNGCERGKFLSREYPSQYR